MFFKLFKSVIKIKNKITITYLMLILICKINEKEVWGSKSFKINLTKLLLKFSKDKLYVFNRLAKKTRPFRLDYRSTLNAFTEIHTIFSHKSLLEGLISLKSLLVNISTNIKCVIHDDSTLTSSDMLLIKYHLPDSEIITFSEATLSVLPLLEKYNTLSNYRKNEKEIENIHSLISTIDIPLLATQNKILFFESSILFFKKANTIISWIESNEDLSQVVFIKDYIDTSILTNSELKEFFSLHSLEKFNSGLFCYEREKYDLKEFEEYYAVLCSLGKERMKSIDQTFWMIHTLSNYEQVLQLNWQYQLTPTEMITPNTICCYYATELNKNFYSDAIYLMNTLELY